MSVLNSLDIKLLLRQFLIQRFLTERLIRFTNEEGIPERRTAAFQFC
jgi:hypothetical protein